MPPINAATINIAAAVIAMTRFRFRRRAASSA